MQAAPIPQNEFSRSRSLRALNILDSTSDIRFDLITHFASHQFNAPITAITLIDTNRQWFKSVYGIEVSEIPRSVAMCAHAIYQVQSNKPKERIFEVSNTVADFRFADNSQVTQDPNIRSYISYVIQSRSGENIGTFCIADMQTRIFTLQEKKLLISLGEMSQQLINTYYDYSLTHAHYAAL